MLRVLYAVLAVAATLALVRAPAAAAAGTPPPDQSALERIPVTCTFTDARLTIHTGGLTFWLDGHHYLITTQYADGVPFATNGQKTGLPVAGHCTSLLPGFEWYSADVAQVW